MIVKIIIVLLTFSFSKNAIAHRGGQIKYGKLKGCHSDSKKGNFHCHSKSALSGKSFSSKEQALKAAGGSPKKAKKKGVEGYNRKSWGGWADFDSDCQNTRHEILISRSIEKVVFGRRGCNVKAGKWKDWYYPEVLTKAKNIDIDHVVPVAHAWATGAANWSSAKKKRFYNDPVNLVITNKSYNRQKGAKRFDQWHPIHKDYACKYARRWFFIKKKYDLAVSAKEKSYFQTLKCPPRG